MRIRSVRARSVSVRSVSVRSVSVRSVSVRVRRNVEYMKSTRRLLKKNSGSITVEAAIALPLFILAVLSLISIFQVIYVYETVFYTLKRTAERISIYSYVYQVSGLSEKNADLNQQINVKKNMIDRGISIFESIKLIKSSDSKVDENTDTSYERYTGNGIIDNIISSNTSINESINEIIDKFNSVSDYTQLLTSQPQEGIESIIYCLIGLIYSKGKGQLTSPFVKQIFINNLYMDTGISSDNYLKALRVKDGFKGMDFSESEFFNDNESMRLVVAYTIKPIMPIPVMPEIEIKQALVARAWLDGDSCNPNKEGIDTISSIESIWKLHPLRRGRAIAKAEGANLPDTAGAANAFDRKNGSVTNIASIDITAKSYQDYNLLKLRINDEIDRIYQFNGFSDEKRGITIRENEITDKHLLLIIPEVELSEEVISILEDCNTYANEKAVIFTWKKAYGATENEIAEKD